MEGGLVRISAGCCRILGSVAYATIAVQRWVGTFTAVELRSTMGAEQEREGREIERDREETVERTVPRGFTRTTHKPA